MLRKSPVLGAGYVLLWTILWLVTMDVVVNMRFAYPTAPDAMPSRVQQYFEYGRSTEGKLRYMIGDTNQTTSSVTLAGWMDDGKVRPTSAEKPGGTLVGCYGQSFTEHACDAWAKQNDMLTMRVIGGPAAPLNHSYAAYLADRRKHDAKVCVLGVLASSLPYLDTISGMTWSFERPYSFMYPRYLLNDGKLRVVDPTIHSMEQFRKTFSDPIAWPRLLDHIGNYDAFFDLVIVKANITDQSAIMRMIRRAWGQRHMRDMLAHYHTAQGFNPTTDLGDVARYLVVDWAKKVREDGRLPIVYVINDRGFKDHLYQELRSVLRENHISYVSTHAYAPAEEFSNFLPDGHFVHAVDEMTAQRFQAIIDKSKQPQ